jgi:sugar lactone lactonase YvrE
VTISNSTYSEYLGASTIASLRVETHRDEALAHWRGSHAQLAARAKGLLEYRQHHLEQIAADLWPTIEDVSTRTDKAHSVDGLSELTFNSVFTLIRNRRYNKLIQNDERNFFSRTCFRHSVRKGVRWYDMRQRGTTVIRCAILLRSRSNIGRSKFRDFIDNTLVPALSSNENITELRSHLLKDFNTNEWQSPEVSHGCSGAYQYDAVLYVGASSQKALQLAFNSAALKSTLEAQQSYCDAIHTHLISDTYIFTRDGRPTIPQIKPEHKPSLRPIRRIAAARPTRADQTLSNLGSADLIGLTYHGAEDVVVDNIGRPICAFGDGRIVRIDPETLVEETLGNTHGRPLGLEVLSDGQLLVCDAHLGLLRVDPNSKSIETLVQYIEGVPLRFCSNATARADGTIWFTESTSRFDFEHYAGDMLEGSCSGRLFRRDPDGYVSVVAEGLAFVNGLTITEDETAIIYAETCGFRLTRLWLSGPKQGLHEVIADNLPGYPDNLSKMRNGRFWVGIPSTRSASSDKSIILPNALRKLLWRLPDHWLPKPTSSVWTMAFDADGNVLEDLQQIRLDYGGATGVAEYNGTLYFASVTEQGILRVKR